MGLSVKAIKTFKNFSIDIDFQVAKELAVLFGPSGSGKSVTLKMIAGLLLPDQGRVTLNEETLFESKKMNKKPQERSIGYVFQNHSIFPHMSVRENILFGARKAPLDIKEKSCTHLLEIFQIAHIQEKFPHEISGGENQRVALARALMQRPKALLLDEPFSALDLSIRIKMREYLQVVRSELNIPVILVTHDLSEALALADKILVYEQGKILQRGTPSEIQHLISVHPTK